MGTQSFGKGSVQTVLQLDDARAIKLTPHLLHAQRTFDSGAGYHPDIIVDDAFVTRRSRSFPIQ